ncbi:SulP family inorganic anion transporter [Thiohalobacter sp.]|uniref:SulP family inorganic anion transporter n=1 Tax=Thiohalobacter sp. TaxID=2025948 RepID=UPI002620DC99|nr:SulP family inorganic anion transporter [Thiohalobacter sp.]
MPDTQSPFSLYNLFPFLRWRNRVNRDSLRADFIAGLTGAIIVLPQGVAFATIAGMPPEYGLYAGMVPAIIAALWGSSWHLVSGPTTAASIVLFSALSALAVPGTEEYVKLALTLTFMVGVIELTLGLAKLGTLVNFISHSVVVGFTAGAAILIAAKQLKNFFGVEIPRGGHLPEVLMHFWEQIPNINPYVTTVAVVTLASGILSRRIWPKAPNLIIAMLAGSFLALFLNNRYGVEVTGITSVGALPQTLPPLSSPDFSLDAIKDLAPAALAVTLFALTEAVSIARSLGARSGQLIDGNQEFIGQGLSNVFGSFFSGYVATGSFNRSGLNYQAGARTPLAAVFAGSLLMLIVVLVAPYARYLPNAAMAGILFMVAWGLIDFREIRHILKVSTQEAAVMGVTFFGALFLDLEFAIFAGVMLSLALYLNRTSRPKIATLAPDPDEIKHTLVSLEHKPLEQCPQLRILRIEGSLFFGAVNHVANALQRLTEKHPDQKHVLIIGDAINFVDLAGAEFLVSEARRMEKLGGGLYLTNLRESVRQCMEKAGFISEFGEDHVFDNKSEAIQSIFLRLDKSRCRICDKRIFNECASVPMAKLASGKQFTS